MKDLAVEASSILLILMKLIIREREQKCSNNVIWNLRSIDSRLSTTFVMMMFEGL